MAFGVVQTMIEVLKQCGDNLTRHKVMRLAANLHDFRLGMRLPGMTINTSPVDFTPIEPLPIERFNGRTWELFGPLLTGALTSS
jgi:hypothetical protein